MNEKEIQIEITLEGTCIAVYDDSLPLSDLGNMKVTRLSDVEFDEHLQSWQVRFRNGVTLPRAYKSRIAAINAEIDYVQAHLSEFGEWVMSQQPQSADTHVDASMS